VTLEALPLREEKGKGPAIGYYEFSNGSYALQDRYSLPDDDYLLKYQKKDHLVVVLARNSRDCHLLRIQDKRIHLLRSQVPPLSLILAICNLTILVVTFRDLSSLTTLQFENPG
jgi:hypothetical protein